MFKPISWNPQCQEIHINVFSDFSVIAKLLLVICTMQPTTVCRARPLGKVSSVPMVPLRVKLPPNNPSTSFFSLVASAEQEGYFQSKLMVSSDDSEYVLYSHQLVQAPVKELTSYSVYLLLPTEFPQTFQNRQAIISPISQLQK